MKIELIIEALELALNSEYLCEYCRYYDSCCSAGEACAIRHRLIEAVAEARKMQEPCVWRKEYISGQNFVRVPDHPVNKVAYPAYCPECGRKVKYED